MTIYYIQQELKKAFYFKLKIRAIISLCSALLLPSCDAVLVTLYKVYKIFKGTKSYVVFMFLLGQCLRCAYH